MGQGLDAHADDAPKPSSHDANEGGGAGSSAGTLVGTRDCRRYCVFEEMDHTAGCDGGVESGDGSRRLRSRPSRPGPRGVHGMPEIVKCCVPWCGPVEETLIDVHEQPAFGPRLSADHFAVVPSSSANAGQARGSNWSRGGEIGVRSGDALRTAVTSDSSKLRAVQNARIPNGGVFTGQVNSSGRPHGDGVQRYPDGAVYEGQWSEGAAHGLGELRLQNGKGYAGQWQAGLKHGEGSERYESGAEFQGSFACGAKEGAGTLTWANGATYCGDFRCGKCHGEGQLRYTDGREYNGQWQSGAMHGVGNFVWHDGKSYTGHYQENKRHGPGVFTWPDGSLCKGRWENGKLHGSGTYIDGEGTSWHGRWVRGERQYWTD